MCIYTHIEPATTDVFPVVANMYTKSIQKQIIEYHIKSKYPEEFLTCDKVFILFIYYFPTIKITQALHYTKMWRGDLRKPQGLYEEAPSLQ